MEAILISLFITLVNAFFAVLNHRGKNYKVAMFSSFVTGMSLISTLKLLSELIYTYRLIQ